MPLDRSPEFDTERLLCGALLSRFPEAVARRVRRLHREHLRHQVALEVLEWARERARRQGLLSTVEDELLGAGSTGLLAVHERRILDQLVQDPSFLGWLNRRVDEVRRVAHLSKVDPDQVTAWPESMEATAPVEGELWKPSCDLGLGTATVLDEAADGFWVWNAKQIGKEAEYRNERARDAGLRVLHLDPRGGPLARAVGTLDLPAAVTVQELGPELSATRVPTSKPRVVQNRCAAIILEHYDFIAWAVPSPSLGAASNQAEIYDHPGTIQLSDDTHCIEVPWLGKLGPRRWRDVFSALLRGLLPVALATGGTAIIRVPLGVRIQQRPRRSRSARNGYEPRPDLLDGLLGDLEQVGLEIAAAYYCEDADPPPQPFVGRSRPASRILVLRRIEVWL